jgi:hypothetical protein
MTVIYRDLIASQARTSQVITDVTAAFAQGRNCLVLTSWIAHLQKLVDGLRAAGHYPVVLRGGMGAKDRAAAARAAESKAAASPTVIGRLFANPPARLQSLDVQTGRAAGAAGMPPTVTRSRAPAKSARVVVTILGRSQD